MTTSQSQTAQRATVLLRPRAIAPRQARKLVRDLATGSGLPQHVIDDAAFIVGELVVTSIREVHRMTTVTVELDGSQVTVRVHDEGGEPAASCGATGAGASRRWDIVRRLASSWGYSLDGAQRELWATVRSERALVAA